MRPEQYTGVDSSQGMLNELVLKHPEVNRVVPARFENIPDETLGGPFDLVVAMNVSGVETDRLLRLCQGLLITGPPVIVERGRQPHQLCRRHNR